MATPKDRKKNDGNNGASIAPEQTTPETQPEHAPPPEPQGEGNPENPAQAGEQEPPAESQDEPGPEDFARHTGARLIQDHEHDLRIQAEVEDRIRRRGHEIATRLRKSGPNATVTIGGKEHVARQRPANSGGGMLLAEVGKRVAASLD